MGAPTTPEEWFNLLNARFTGSTAPRWEDHRLRPNERKPRNEVLDTLWSYYVGDPPLPQIADSYRPIFIDEMRKARCNYAPMCVAAMLDRMELQAVSTDVDDDTGGDDRASQIMDESGFAAMFKDLLGYLFAMGEAFALATPGDATNPPAAFAVDPRRCVGITDPLNPTRLRAALIREWDPVVQEQKAYLYLPGQRWEMAHADGVWTPAGDPVTVEGLDDLGGIPVVRFENANKGMGEYEAHIDLLDRIIDTTLQRLVLTKYQAFRQRAVVGDLEDDDDDEEDVEPINWDDILSSDPGAVWRLPADTTFWESSQADLTPIITAKRDDVKEFAAVTSTPLHLITPDAANGSAEGAALMRESATSKIRDRRARVTPALRLLWRILFALDGAPRRAVRVHWGPIEFRSLAEKGSASAQAAGALSAEAILTGIWEFSPQDAQRVIDQRLADQLLLAAPASLPGPVETAPAAAGSGLVES